MILFSLYTVILKFYKHIFTLRSIMTLIIASVGFVNIENIIKYCEVKIFGITGIAGILVICIPLIIVILIGIPNYKRYMLNRNIVEAHEKNHAMQWIINILQIIITLYYSSITNFNLRPGQNAILELSWVSIFRKITVEEKLAWFEKIKTLVHLDPQIWQAIERGIDWNTITKYDDLLLTVRKLLEYSESIEKSKPGLFTNFIRGVAQTIGNHPYLSLLAVICAAGLIILYQDSLYKAVSGMGTSIIEYGKKLEDLKNRFIQAEADMAIIANQVAVIEGRQTLHTEELARLKNYAEQAIAHATLTSTRMTLLENGQAKLEVGQTATQKLIQELNTLIGD